MEPLLSPSSPPPQAHVLTTKALVDLARIGEDRVMQIEAAGWIKRTGRNEWPTVPTLAGMIKFYRDENRRGRGPSAEADAKLRAAKALEVELRIAMRSKVLCHVDEAIACMQQVAGMVRAEFGGLAAAFTRDLVERRRLDKEVNARFNRIAKRLDEIIAGLGGEQAALPVPSSGGAAPSLPSSL
jgi:hypothetical protein